jgi:hypothetical protein
MGLTGARFGAGLCAIAAVAFAVRLAYALVLAPDIAGLDDDAFYHLTSLELADGHGYVGTFDVFVSGQKEPTADHPPLYALGLSFLARLGARGVDAQRMLGVCAGTLTVVAVGLAARSLAGRRAGWAAAALCAVYPAFIAADGAIMSESLFGMLVAFALAVALRLLTRPSIAGTALLGLLIGLAALTRSEGLLLLPLLAVSILVAVPGRRVATGATLAVVAALAIAPWVVRNVDVFGEPIYSTNDGATLAGANCEQTYYGHAIGGFDFSCIAAIDQPQTANRAVRSRALRDAAVDYAGDHPGRALVVAGVRLARVWGLYAFDDEVEVTGRNDRVQLVGVIVYYLVLAAGIAGAVLLVRTGRLLPLAVLLTPILVTSATAVLTYGLVRLRHIAEISLIVLAGCALARWRSPEARPGD